MKLELNLKELKQSVRKSRIALENMQTENDKLTAKFIRKATDNLKYIAVTSIDKFYEDYEPHFYERTWELYNAYKVTVTEDSWSVDFNPEWIGDTHRVDPEFIFENSFIQGWHGGGTDGDDHPEPGVPYWRWPDVTITTAYGGQIRAFSHNSPWFTPALKSPSPYKEIVRKSNLYMDLELAKYYEEYNKNVDKFQKQIVRNLERIR